MASLPSVYEPVMQALANLLTAALVPGTFRYLSRRYIPWEVLVNSIQLGAIPFVQPALLIYDGVGFGGGKTTFVHRSRGTPPVRTMHRTLVIYAQLPGGGTPGGIDATTAGGTVFAPLSEAIEGVFSQVDYDNAALTLGGLVQHVWIDGESHWLTGEIDSNGQGMMTIPLNILIP